MEQAGSLETAKKRGVRGERRCFAGAVPEGRPRKQCGSREVWKKGRKREEEG